MPSSLTLPPGSAVPGGVSGALMQRVGSHSMSPATLLIEACWPQPALSLYRGGNWSTVTFNISSGDSVSS